MAFTRKEKEAMVAQYREWVDNSKAFFVLSYQKMNMPAVDDARLKMREINGEMHVVKNRLFKLVMDEKGLDYGDKFWEENNVISFAFGDTPSVAKALSELSKMDIFDIRMGFMDEKLISASQVKALADLPTLPVMRGMLLGTILASASQLVRTLAEPARSMAAVIKAFSEEGKAAESAA